MTNRVGVFARMDAVLTFPRGGAVDAPAAESDVNTQLFAIH